MRSKVVAAAVALVAAVAPVVRAADAPASPYPGGTYTPPDATYGVSQDLDLPVVMDDGTRIAVDVAYPTDPATGARITDRTFPVMLTQDPYSNGGAGALIGAMSGGTPGTYFVERGYIFVHMDLRGSGNSEGSSGVTQLFDPRQGLDGLTVAYWASDPANIPGANGTVGLQGCSALGISQLATLMALGRIERAGGGTVTYTYGGTTRTLAVSKKTNPIKAAIPQCLSGDMYRDTFYDNGIPSPIQGLATLPVGVALSGVRTENPSQNISGTLAGVDVLAGGRDGYYQGAWITNDRVAFAHDLARTGVPILGWVGWGEGGSIGAQQLYGVLQNAAAGKANPWAPMDPAQRPSPKYQMIIGDWGHAGGADQGIEIQWYDTWIKGVDTGLQKADRPLHMQELRAKSPTDTTPGRWINATTYPQTAAYSSYYLGDGGTLATSAPSAGTADQLVWAPQHSVSYTLSEPLAQDMTVMGPASVRVWAKSTGTNMSIYAELQDVDPNTGVATHITHASLLQSRRALDPSKSWTIAGGKLGTASTQGPSAHPIAPYVTLTRDDFSVPAGTPVQLDIPLQPITWRLAKGHQLRLVLASQAPQTQCGLNAKIGAAPTGCLYTRPMLETLPGVYDILHDAEHPSAVTVAMVPSDSLPDAGAVVTPTSGDVAMPHDW